MGLNQDEIQRSLGLSDALMERVADSPLNAQLLKPLRRLAAGQTIADEHVDLLFSHGLAPAVARGYEIAYAAERSLSRASRAARAWRKAQQPRQAMRVLADIDADWLDSAERRVLMTVLAAALADLMELEPARALAQKVADEDPLWADYPHRVLARIAMLEGRKGEQTARLAQADHIYSHRRAAIAEGRLAEAAPPGDAALFRSYRFESERRKIIGRRRYQEYRQREEWQARRRAALARASHGCERCPSNADLHVHHIHYLRIFRELPEDLEVLCARCHAAEHDHERRALNRVAEIVGDVQLSGISRCE